MTLEAVNHTHFLKKGSRLVSSLIRSGNFLYWYCDIIDYEYDDENDKYIFIDLLVDVKVSSDGKIEVLDLDELKEALDKGLIDNERFLDAINKLNRLIKTIEEKNSMDCLVKFLLKTNE